ncbi:MAG TPA: sigma-54 dependent transcriptional regulator, partial [Nitrospiria bacterium]
EREVHFLRAEVDQKYQPDNLIGKSRAMKEVFLKIRQIADARSTVLITGESGTGKEMVARALHYNSIRRRERFIAINCASIPETLIESELFGHEKGAFTDATSRKLGQFEEAQGGTLFLDEIGELTPPIQAKLLRVLQTKQFTRLGGTQTIEVDVRLITATNRNLEDLLHQGALREDLYYRINVLSIHLPPLRDRKEDIPSLAHHFLAQKSLTEKSRLKTLGRDTLAALMHYDWPGNVRELENVIEQAFTFSSGNLIGLEDLPPNLQKKRRANTLKDRALGGQVSLGDAVKAFERDVIETALKKSNQVQTRAAHLLGITRRILKYKMDALGLGFSPPPPQSKRRQTPSPRNDKQADSK